MAMGSELTSPPGIGVQVCLETERILCRNPVVNSGKLPAPTTKYDIVINKFWSRLQFDSFGGNLPG